MGGIPELKYQYTEYLETFTTKPICKPNVGARADIVHM